MGTTKQDDHARAVKRTLEAVFRHVPGVRDAFPALAVVHDNLAVLGLKALDAAPLLDPAEVRQKLGSLLPNFGVRQLEAITQVLTTIDRRGARRDSASRNQFSTPTMFAVEVPMDEFIGALEGQRL